MRLPTPAEDAVWSPYGTGTRTEELPVETAAEREVIVAAMIYPECAAAFSQLMRAEHFCDPAYSAIAGEIIEQHPNGGIDPQLVARNLKGNRAFFDGNAAALVLELCNEYASRYQFPRKCTAIVEASRKREQSLDLSELQRHVLNGHSSHDISRATLETLKKWRETAAGFGQQGPISFADLRSRFPSLRPPVIDGLAREGETINFIAGTKIGKSWFIYLLALCIVMGRAFLDRFPTRQGKSLIIDNELHPETLAYRIRKVAEALGIEPHEYEKNLVVWSLRGKGTTLNEIASELMRFDPGEFQAVFWDSKYRVRRPGAEENSNDDETDFHEVVDSIGDHMRAVQGLIHHSSKGDQSSKRTTDVGAGGGAQSRAVDCHWVMREHAEPGLIVVDTAIRSFQPIEPFTLKWQFPLWVPDDSADPALLKRPLTGNQVRQEAEDRKGMELIIKALRSGPSTARKLREATAIGKDRMERLLGLMGVAGHITPKAITVRGNECNEYTLCE